MQITRGKIQSALKIVIYGPEGIGKSTFAAQFPAPVFIDTEGSTKHMDVARLPKPSSWILLLEEIKFVKNNPQTFKTLIIDTADWAEQLCSDDICKKSKKTGIEDFGYGKGYVYLAEEFGRLLNVLEELIEMGINVVLTAHAQMRKFEQPDEMGSYDRWEMKLQKKTAPMLKEWADMVLFANYKTYVIKIDENKNKAQGGGTRVMYSSHHACWDAKNRNDLPDEMPFQYSSIAHCIPGAVPQTISINPVPETKVDIQQPSIEEQKETAAGPASNTTVQAQPMTENSPVQKQENDLSGVPKPLADLMAENNVTVAEIQMAVSSKGYYPKDTPITNYDPGFISGVLIAAWPQVYQMVKELDTLPF